MEKVENKLRTASKELFQPAKRQSSSAIKSESTDKPLDADMLEHLVIDNGGEKSAFPEDIPPMLATLVDKPVEGDWLYEIKWDGFRSLLYKNKEKVEWRSRNNKSFNEKFYPLFKAAEKLSYNVVLDGEIVVLDKEGLPDFSALQSWRSEADGRLAYFAFDILWINGFSLMNVPLRERRNILKRAISETDEIRISDDFEIAGSDFFEIIEQMGMEGMMAKKADSLYKPDTRSTDWLKIKSKKQQEAVIGGYTINENTSKKFSALLLGLHEDGKFVYTGSVGTGFTTKMQTEILEKLKPLQTKNPPFETVPEYNKPSRFRPHPPKAEVFWVEPSVVAEITYRTVAPDGSFRHPSFKGLREDKSAGEVVREQAMSTRAVAAGKTTPVSDKLFRRSKSERKTLLNPSEETQTREIAGKNLRFPNLSKVFWPKEKLTKRDMLNYYYQVAPFIMPYIKNRPQTLNRFPNGIEAKSFYQKDVKGKVAPWLKTFPYYSESDRREKQFAVCTDEASLLYIASLGCIEINPWSSKVDTPQNPDWCIIDLDPDKNPFEEVIEAAQVIKHVLDALDVPAYCKTSGSTGLHIYIPLHAKYTYEDSKEFGRSLVKVVHSIIPSYTSIERLTANRKGKLYLDFLQNRPQATVAAPYSLRPRPGATVSMPLHWEEVKEGLKIADFTIFNAVERIKEHGDIFKGVLGGGIDLPEARQKLNTHLAASL